MRVHSFLGATEVSEAQTNPAWASILPPAPSTIDTDRGRTVRIQLDPVGKWDSVVACVAGGGPDKPTQIIGHCSYIFLTPESLTATLGRPDMLGRFGLSMRRARLLTLLIDGLEAQSACSGFWIFGLPNAQGPQFLPCSDLMPMADLLETILTLARAMSGTAESGQILSALSDRRFYHGGGWEGGVASTSNNADQKEYFPLYLSPVSLVKSGVIGQVATVRLSEVGPMLGEYSGVIIEPDAGYALVIPKDQLP